MSWHISDAAELEETIMTLKMMLARRAGARNGMTVVDVGCGQGGFTAALSKTIGERGRVVSIDVTKEYLEEAKDRLKRYGFPENVSFIRADAASLGNVLPEAFADLVASYRFLEELTQPKNMAKIVQKMARTAKENGRVSITEMSTEPSNEAEEAYIRLHEESGDHLFERHEIADAIKQAGLVDVHVEKVDTKIWFSPDLAKQYHSHAQVWYNAEVEKSIGKLIDKCGMKYPAFYMVAGTKSRQMLLDEP